jgi:hypothetical protein
MQDPAERQEEIADAVEAGHDAAGLQEIRWVDL